MSYNSIMYILHKHIITKIYLCVFPTQCTYRKVTVVWTIELNNINGQILSKDYAFTEWMFNVLYTYFLLLEQSEYNVNREKWVLLK